MQKGLMIAVALLTFGLITPTHEIWETFDHSKLKDAEVQPTQTNAVEYIELTEKSVADESNTRDYLHIAAKEQSYIKFGSRIAPKISDNFDTLIYPKMQEVIDMTFARLDSHAKRSLVVSEKPSGDYAEKIFNIYHAETGEDFIRFHVRTENRPFDGYYYNFHYHTVEDEFATHHNLGDIFWAKNTPPKWLS